METWKKIDEFDGNYEISCEGNLRRSSSLRTKKLTVGAQGYFVASMWSQNKGKVVFIHHLVAAYFIGPRPEGLQINHIDGVKTNNSVENLEYVTPSRNTTHAIDMGLFKMRGEDSHRAKLSNSDVREIRRLLKEGMKGSDVARMFGVKAPIISQIKHGTRWGHLI